MLCVEPAAVAGLPVHCPPVVVAYYSPSMSAPTVLILAAGQGTRMRSATPKVLHELCGRAMVLWPVCAALQAGAGRVVVVDSPARRWRRCWSTVLPQGVGLVVQPRSNGTGGAVVAAATEIDPTSAAVVVLSGDVPLVSAQAIGELLEAHAASGAPATMATTVLADPSGYGRVVRDDAGQRGARGGDEESGRRDRRRSLQIEEVNTGIYVFDGDALLGPCRA